MAQTHSELAPPGLGERIRTRRMELGLTQAQLGRPEFTAAYISLIEAGHRQPSPETLSYLAERLDLDLEELLTGRPTGIDVELELRVHEARREVDEGRIDVAEALLDEVAEGAARFGLNRTQARAEEVRGALAERRHGPAAALEHYKKAEALWTTEPRHHAYETVAGIAWCTQQLGDPALAAFMLDSYKRELLAAELPHPVALMRINTALVYPYFSLGLPEKAGDAAREALRLELRVDDPEQIACMHLTVARSLLYQGESEDALASLRKAEDIYLSRGWRNQVAKARIAEAIVLAKSKDFEAAKGRLEEALELLGSSPNRVDEALALNELGYVLRHLRDIDGAIAHLERARPLLEGFDIAERAFNEREVALCLLESDPTAAETHLKKAIESYRSAGASAELASTYKLLGELYLSQDRVELAVDTFRRGLEAVEERKA